MVTIFAFEFTQQLDVGIWGTRRKTYEEGERVICTREDYLTLHRLGCKEIWKAELSFDDVESFLSAPEVRTRPQLSIWKQLSAKEQKALDKAKKVLEDAQAEETEATAKVAELTTAKTSADEALEKAKTENADDATLTPLQKTANDAWKSLEDAQAEETEAKKAVVDAQEALDSLSK